MNEKAVSRNHAEYVAGFVFDLTGRYVLLISKKKPAWQWGRLNGIGGKVGPGETPKQAMVREFGEECDLIVQESDWHQFNTLGGEGFRVHFFSAFHPSLDSAKSKEAEQLLVVRSDDLPPNVIPNLRWLIPMALSLTMGESCRQFQVMEAV